MEYYPVFNKSFKNLSIFSLLNTNVEGRGRVSFDSFIEKFRISGGWGKLWFPLYTASEGNINGSTKFVLSQNDQNLSVEQFDLELRNEQDEKIVCSLLNQYEIQSDSLDFALFFEKRLIWEIFESFPQKSLISGKLAVVIMMAILRLEAKNFNF